MDPSTSSPDGGTPPPIIPAESVPISRARWWIHLILIGAYPIVLGVLSWLRAPSSGPALPDNPSGLLLVCGEALLMFGIVFGLAWLASRASRDDLLLRWRHGIWIWPLGIGYSIALRLAVGLVVAVLAIFLIATSLMTPQKLQQFVLENRPDVEALVDPVALRQNPLYLWLNVTFVSFVVAGLREELWRSAFLTGLRALWPRFFGSRVGQLGAVSIAAVSFGLGHLGQGWIAVGVTAVLGFGLGVIMVLHRSIWPAVIAHGAFDATSFAVLPWALDSIKELQKTLGP